MRRLLLISLATIPLAGCQFFNKGADVAIIDPLDPASLSEAGSSLPDGDEATDAEAFADPTVKSAGASVSADLIQSTDANARTLKVQRSRSDPFATLPIPPPPELAELPVGAAGNGISVGGSGAAGSGARSSGVSQGAGASARTGAASNGGGPAAAARSAPTPPPVRVQPAGKPLVNPSPIATLPPVPQPIIAPTVSVSGVIQLGSEPYAILRSGSEPERYVKVGDRIAGGSVRVKRIETLAFEPKVILEENGVEVSRPITANVQAERPTAPALPVSTPPIPVPSVPVPSNQALLPNLPVVPVPAASTNLQPSLDAIPGSLILSPPETNSQAMMPGLPVVAVYRS